MEIQILVENRPSPVGVPERFLRGELTLNMGSNHLLSVFIPFGTSWGMSIVYQADNVVFTTTDRGFHVFNTNRG